MSLPGGFQKILSAVTGVLACGSLVVKRMANEYIDSGYKDNNLYNKLREQVRKELNELT